MKIGIICAMEQEISLLIEDIVLDKCVTIAGRSFYQGRLYHQPVVLVLSGIGKVAAAITTTILIQHFDVQSILFSGTAGAIDPALSIGDVVVANQCIQYDFSVDTTPTFRIPIIEKSYFETDPSLTQQAVASARHYLDNVLPQQEMQAQARHFSIQQPKVLVGTIASGDSFIRTQRKKEWLLAQIQDLKCVEMEGASTAQVCHAYDIPYTVIRIISDQANQDASFSFDLFIQHIARIMVRGVICHVLESVQ